MKILIISEYKKNEANSVSEILTNVYDSLFNEGIYVRVYVHGRNLEKIVLINNEYIPKKIIYIKE